AQSVWDIQPLEVTQEGAADDGVVWTHVSRKYRLPPAAEVREGIIGALREAVAREGAELHLVNEDPEGMLVSVTFAGVETHSLQFTIGTVSVDDETRAATPGLPDAAPAIAIIVDDLGYGDETTERLCSLKLPLTVAVLPKLAASRESAERARNAGFEVMLHLPMEAEGNAPPEPGELRVGMSRDTMARLIEENLATVPGTVGVNNHKGSIMTELEGEMSKFLPTIGEQNLYFVDSLTTPESVALDVARKCGLKAIGNDIFLDNERDRANIEERLNELMRTAKRRGYAVGICHAKTATIDVLRELLPTMRERGFRLVPVSELLEKYG
ncbi:MAG: divergent polysaccharide deacetylase family protein, partial [Candidatus Hydrogenedentes bacterium]|nr:divergent polysaccharide deacetylase family protein [Candidatus Hydrogenedentota bacterium]